MKLQLGTVRIQKVDGAADSPANGTPNDGNPGLFQFAGRFIELCLIDGKGDVINSEPGIPVQI